MRGLRNQFAVQGIEGVQVLESPVFYDGIPGLLGPFHYLPGFNLVCKNYSFSDSQHMDHSFIRDPDYILNLFRKQLDEGIIAKIHQKGIMHRDVKPGNIVYTNGNRRLNLIDWSISASFNEDFEDLSCGSFLGTRGYVTNNLNCSRDYFALGVSFAKVLCPELPIQNGLYVSNFEDDFRKVLRNKGQRFEDYFLDLISRPSEYDHNDFKLSQLEPSKDFLSVNCIADTTWVTSEYQTT